MTLQMRRAAAVLVLTALCVAAPARAQFGAGPKLEAAAKTETDGVLPGATVRAAFTFTLPLGWHVNAHKPLEEFLIATELKLEGAGPVHVARIAYPKHKLFKFSFSEQQMAVYEQTFTVGAELKIAQDAAAGDYTLKGVLNYQACNDKMCAPPAEKEIALVVKVLPVGSPAPAVPAKPLTADLLWETAETVGAAASVAPVTPSPAALNEGVVAPKAAAPQGDWRTLAATFRVKGRLDGFADIQGFLAFLDAADRGESAPAGFKGKSLGLVLLLVLGGGLLLNLTPCVLPLMPINVAIIGAGARAGSRTRGFLLGGAYGAGIALVYGALGLVVVLGVSAAFGAINSMVWFNVAIAILFVLLGLAMFDLIQIDFSRFQAKLGIRGNAKGSFLIALAMGAVSALLAGACVAPVVIYTILYAQDLYSQGYALALLLPFLLGAGMALPWPFLGAGLSFLPKPGKWMIRVKQAFGVLILGFALYYGYLAWTLTGAGKPASSETDGWTASLEAGLAQAAAAKKPVLIDFWATWCKNCLVMDKTVLKDPAVLKRLDGYVKIKYQAETLTVSPALEVVEHFKVLGLPAYVLLEPKG